MPRKAIYRYLDNYLRLIDGPTIFEVGAHIGTDTIQLARYMDGGGLLVCFEPHPSNIAALFELQKEHRFELVDRAIGREVGWIPFWLSSGQKPGVERTITDLSSTLTPKHVRDKHPWARFMKIDVLCTTLDEYCRKSETDRIDFLWADIQGGELDLVWGAQEILKRTGLFYFECADEHRELYAGQPTLAQILKALPKGTEWRMEFRSKTDVLLLNLPFTEWMREPHGQ